MGRERDSGGGRGREREGEREGPPRRKLISVEGRCSPCLRGRTERPCG